MRLRYKSISHFFAKLTRRYYYEDYRRVYPEDIIFDRFGNRRQPTKNELNNFLNHSKFYEFAAQFVSGRRALDAGCGSGYGCEILKKAGATLVYGCDISRKAIEFAASRYSNCANFTIQGINNMKKYHDDSFDISISSEVLEHVKEYGVEEKAIKELKRVTKNGGLIIIGTPNSEMLWQHGFAFGEINSLLGRNFAQFCIFENALIPFGDAKVLWESRLSEGKVGVIISQLINLSDTVLPDGINPEIKKGIKAGKYQFAGYTIDTTLLHNTHSWIIIAINEK